MGYNGQLLIVILWKVDVLETLPTPFISLMVSNICEVSITKKKLNRSKNMNFFIFIDFYVNFDRYKIFVINPFIPSVFLSPSETCLSKSRESFTVIPYYSPLVTMLTLVDLSLEVVVCDRHTLMRLVT